MSLTDLLPMANRRVQPWKNGGGTTTEIVISPPDAGLEDFDWRISMASVTASGPFSIFRGFDRILAVIEGQLELAFEYDASQISLTADSPPHVFSGDVAVVGKPQGQGSRVIDLNLITRRGKWTGVMERIEIPRSVTLTAPVSVILFVNNGHLKRRGTTVLMRSLDAVRIDEAEGEIIELAGAGHVYVIGINTAERNELLASLTACTAK